MDKRQKWVLPMLYITIQQPDFITRQTVGTLVRKNGIHPRFPYTMHTLGLSKYTITSFTSFPGIQTQVLVLVGPALYPLNQLPNPFFSDATSQMFSLQTPADLALLTVSLLYSSGGRWNSLFPRLFLCLCPGPLYPRWL